MRKWIMAFSLLAASLSSVAEQRLMLGSGYRWTQDVTFDQVDTGIREDQSLAAAFEWSYSAVADWQVYLSQTETEVDNAERDALDIRVAQIGGVRWLESGDFRPYLGATGGVTQLSLDDDTMTRASLSLFAGLNWDIASAAAIRAELRWIGTYVDSETELRCAGGRCVLTVDAGLWRQTDANLQVVFRF